MKACIFDLDGTLLDSNGLWGQIDIDFLTGRGFTVPPDYMDAVCSLSFPEAARYTIRRFGLSVSVEELLAEWNTMAAYAYGHTVPMKPHAKQYLAALMAQGARLAVATSLPSALYSPALEHHGIRGWFSAICSTDEVAHGKTRPDIFLLAAERLEEKPENCIVFEDIPAAVQSAKAAGMTVYGVYDEASKGHWAAMKKVADGVIHSFRDAPLPK